MESIVFMYILQSLLTLLFVLGVLGYLVYEAYFSKAGGNTEGKRAFNTKATRYI